MPPPSLQNDSEPGRPAPGALAQAAPAASEPRGLPPRTRLAACLAAVAACWLLALPMAARTPAVRGMVERNERLGLNPSAKFYSELPGMPRVKQRMEAVRAGNAEAFWQPARRE